ncbi:nicotinate-nucleotide adenylyltransferase [Lactobacillus sp. S2-2]|uniref:nicotinate-nucleotide adenylyltransferase n=1 Tax=Lactobacillus sp. S2-2 TaxID=2692917 RepID=UPI001F01F318|nr:nicotinate-nucleotide adenylyltransferase [Lactobacillus sp. S2-2]MCF6515143.1 nicotinate-nucleotide adenylyltransferase [Lactobacillus sp. S2-2]
MNKKKQRIGILGGTFNPIHNGHLIIANQAYDQLELDKVLFLPDYIPPHVDKKEAISANKRVEMIEKSIENYKQFDIELLEIERKGKSYTYDTIKKLIEINPNVEYYFIIGGDMVDYLPKWYRIKDLFDMINFVGVKRLGSSGKSNENILWIDCPLIQISSSLIRDYIQKNKSIEFLVPEKVNKFIKEHHLYE